MTVNIDLYNEAMCLNALSEGLSGEAKATITETLDLLVAISSGFPFNFEEWERLEVLIDQSLNTLKNKL
ncbi:hypothetical protein AB6D10_19250 [Vibrio splendidus]